MNLDQVKDQEQSNEGNMSSWSLVSFTTLIWIVCAQLCDSDYLFMSCNEKPNIVAWNVNTSKLLTKKLLDTTSIDWISSKDLRFRGMAIMDDILFVANSKEDVSFIGKWSCQPDTKDGGSSNFDKLAFIGNFTGVCLHVVFVFCKHARSMIGDKF